MSKHRLFVFRTSGQLFEKAHELGIELPFQDDLGPLFEGVFLGSRRIVNRLAVHPMEGFDGNADGSPGDLTFRRYTRFARGGSGLIWFEATSVSPEGRSNPRQLWIHPKSLDGFRKLVEETKREAIQEFGAKHDVYCVLQLTHSGRYSKPEGRPEPQVALFNPLLDKQKEGLHIFSDFELDRLQERYVEAARLARQAGFEAVDIKACHGYLVNELLAAYERRDSLYGESFDHRIRFITEVIQKIRQDDVPGLDLAVRLNAYDGLPYPYGFGVSKEQSTEVDLAEPIELISQLVKAGCELFNITAGIPSVAPHVGRPFNRPMKGSPIPSEHPLEGICRLLTLTAALQKEFPGVPMIGTGYSWLRQFFPYVGAAVLARKEASSIGLGRMLFAYPDAPRDLMEKGALDPKKVCTTCSRCSEMMRWGEASGCAVHDKKIYGEPYKHMRKQLRKQFRDQVRKEKTER
jgi:2,4-dienoyl-CoA reductase-like NADH-dependent reductase (Old Yellow Enzyme family)